MPEIYPVAYETKEVPPTKPKTETIIQISEVRIVPLGAVIESATPPPNAVEGDIWIEGDE